MQPVWVALGVAATGARASVVTGELAGDETAFSSAALRAQEMAVTITSRSAPGAGSTGEDAPTTTHGKGLLLGHTLLLTSLDAVAIRDAAGSPMPLDEIAITGARVRSDRPPTLLVLIAGADLALLRVETDVEPPAPRLGDSTALQLGDAVYSPSDPGERAPLMAGLVVGETVRHLSNVDLRYLETTLTSVEAPPGAPVFDQRGEVVGVAAAQAADGTALVLCIEDVKRVLLPLAAVR
jgi:hypothetical protein